MLRISQIKMSPDHTMKDLKSKAAKCLKLKNADLKEFSIVKKSIDARHKPDIKYVYTVDVAVDREERLLRKIKSSQITKAEEKCYRFPKGDPSCMQKRPVIIGSGPAGLFCAYMLSLSGYRPIVYERGASVEQRCQDVTNFWETGILDPESNVQFGEGGAGTFSDGKLNTLIKDKDGRNKKVLEIFVENGAPEDILYNSKPHIGTDILIQVIKNMRNRILVNGGDIYFHSCFTDLMIQDGKLQSVTIRQGNKTIIQETSNLVLALGHSARDTFQMLYEKQIPMQAKAFAVGVRIEHPQKMINDSQYGKDCPYELAPAAYKVAKTLKNQKGVYSFCMCPGGYVVNASSEEKRLAVNGMSYRKRDGENANSAIIVTVAPKEYGDGHPLSGIAFQRQLEEKAWKAGDGKIPVQRFADFKRNCPSCKTGAIKPQMKGMYQPSNVREIFPEEIGSSIEEGILCFDRQIPGFADDDALLSAVESRTSSPVRVLRNEQLQVSDTGIYPCGEGAGYAGGITSAAADGIRVAEQIVVNCNNLFTKK